MGLHWLFYTVPAMAVLGLIVMAAKSAWVTKQDAGDANMKELAKHIADGAMAFLKAEWRVMAIYAVIAAGLLAWSGTLVEHSNWLIGVAFLIGAVLSAFAGYIGMNIATKSNVRTTQAARTSLSKALAVSFSGGTVMGLGVASLAVLGLGSLFILFYMMFVDGADPTGGKMETALEVLAGFSLGAESIALFARVGGGIYTKAADVGADLVGKVEAGIPEDDPRNPATIADNVGDNVGDVAGMGADLFGSYVATILATMVLGREVASTDDFGNMAPILVPMVVAGIGLIFSIIATLFVRVSSESGNVQNALNIGNWGSMIFTAIASAGLVMWVMPEEMTFTRTGETFTNMDVIYCIMVGLVVGAIMSIVTEHYTAMGRGPVNRIIQQSSTGHATNIIGGLAIGMESTVIPVIVLAAGIMGSFHFAGLYGVAIAAAGMMATTAMQLAIDAFGPIADNAGGIAEMSGLPEEVRDRTDNLDAVGNTTAATGKGFAIASAALTALALFAAYVGVANIDSIDIYKADVLGMLFVGGMIPFIFSSLAISAVGRAAMAMVKEVRRQFKEIPGIMEGTGKPEYEKCVDISTKASIREMIAPGALALIAPVIVGFAFGPEALGGLLAGITVSGVLMGIFQNNAGGAWDNAKKSFEKGVEVDGKMEYKGSDPHKASVTGDTVGDPFKDTSGPSMNILIKLTTIVALIIAPHIAEPGSGPKTNHDGDAATGTGTTTQVVSDNSTAGAAATGTATYSAVKADSRIKWAARKVGGQHNGLIGLDFADLYFEGEALTGGTIVFNMNDIVVSDIEDPTDRQDLENHLRNADFFDAENHPKATFTITQTIDRGNDPEGGRVWQARGDLEIKGQSNRIGTTCSIKFEGDKVIVYDGETAFDRTKWDISYKSKSVLGDAADFFIHDEIAIDYYIVAEKNMSQS